MDVFKIVTMIVLAVYVHLQVTGFGEIDGVKLKVFFVEEVVLVLQFIISCVFIDVLGSLVVLVGLVSVPLYVHTAELFCL